MKKLLPRCLLFVKYRFLSTTSLSLHNKHIEYCMNLVKTRDFDNYLACVLLPDLTQNVALTVRAFNIEIAQIQEATTNTQTGKMRIDFWRKNIASTFQGTPPNHPVTIALALCLEKQWLSEKWFQRGIDVRERYLNNVSFMTLDDAEEYGEYAVSSLFYLILESLQVSDNDVYYAASHLGIACSLITLLRSVPYYLNHGSMVLPTELCIKHAVSQEEILRAQKKEALAEIIYDVASQASLHIDGMKKLLKESVVPIDTKNVFLPYIGSTLFLEHIRKLNFDINHMAINRKQWTLPIRIFYNSKKNKIG